MNRLQRSRIYDWEIPQLKLRAFFGCTFLPLLSFLVAFFDAMDFLLLSDCPHGPSVTYRQMRGHMSRGTRPQLIPRGMCEMRWLNSADGPARGGNSAE
jgi:hypothetical protein